ncbi:MAG: hypothetical protein ABS75_10545 [Pelagibacterium sp. SCN 63-23]|nr:MAG: hypothetical protein ABS75_10545 [Pelagibacterium sp. SCN 63-23]
MCRLGLVCIVVLASSGAIEAQDDLAIDQIADGNQLAGNSVDVQSLEALTDALLAQMMDFRTLGNLTQSGMNTVNTVAFGGDLGAVVQRFHGEQSVSNLAALGSYSVGGLLFQDGKNVAGMASADTLAFADQLFGADARQLIFNNAEIAYLSGGVSQRGSNTANMVTAERAIGTASQTIELGAVQRVDNVLHLAAMASVDAYISQYGENYGNVMQSDTVDSATRIFAGDQIVHNVVTLEELSAGRIDQRGVNVANMIQSSRIGSITQISVGTQSVINQVFGPNGQLLTGDNIVQSTDNMVNVTILTAPDGNNDNGLLSVEQSADFPQSMTGNSGSQTGNAVVINR